MYENVKARIRCGATFTDYINCTRGVKQGDVCSPVLFSLFINDLVLDIINNGRHGVSLSSDFVQLVILLFNNNKKKNVHLSCAHQRPERSHDTY